MQAPQYPDLPDDLGHWLAGFIDGEGYFGIRQHPKGPFQCVFSLGLRIDDSAILEELHTRTGLGSLYVDRARQRRNPNAEAFRVWLIMSKRDCVALIPLLERFPLRSKKRSDFEIWARAVRAWQHVIRNGRNQDWSAIRQLKEELELNRRAGLSPLTSPQPPLEKPPQLWIENR